MLNRNRALALVGAALFGLGAAAAQDGQGWLPLFNGKDTAGWKLRADKITATKYLDAAGAEIPGAKKSKLDQRQVIVNAKGEEIKGAKAIQEAVANSSGWVVENG